VPPLLLVFVLQAAPVPAPMPAPDPKLIRVYVQTEVSGEAIDLAGKRQSVKDLTASLAGKKKTLAVVDLASAADVVVEVAERSIVTPKFVMGLQPRSGDPMPVTGPTRQTVLRVTLTSGAEALGFTNKNKPVESPTGWRMAADDVAGQIEKWAAAHRDEIVKRRRSAARPD
jgi:hypothetical protein